MESDDVHIAPGGGPLVDLGGLGVHFKVRGELAGGRFAVVEHPVQPGVLVDPHIHNNEDELSYVVEGSIWARVGDRELEAAAGAYVWKPVASPTPFDNDGEDRKKPPPEPEASSTSNCCVALGARGLPATQRGASCETPPSAASSPGRAQGCASAPGPLLVVLHERFELLRQVGHPVVWALR